MNQKERDVWHVVQEMNKTWTTGKPEALKDFFHRDMVAITATDRLRLEGRDSCIAGWKAFSDAAKIHYWKEIDPKIQLYGDTAVVTYYFDMSFDMGARRSLWAAGTCSSWSGKKVSGGLLQTSFRHIRPDNNY